MKKFNKQYLNDALAAIHFNELTDVQAKVLELDKQNQPLIIEAKTGSGKTHSFLLPILENLDEDILECQAVIVAPTRELALQIEKFARDLIKHSDKIIKISMFTGGTDRDQSIENLSSQQPHIVIGTPGRLHDLVFKENILKIYTAKYFIIDEADMALDQNFIEELSNLANICQRAKIMVFSATIPERLMPFLKKYLNNPISLKVHPDEISNLNIDHYFIKSKEKPRMDILNQILNAINPYLAIIFCNTKESAEEVYEMMSEKNYNVALFHGGLAHRKRKQLIQRVNHLDFQYLVATDILARGIDIVGVSHVINYELPQDTEFYIHRSGRTGRINMDGQCLSIYEFNDNQYLDDLERKGVKTHYKDIKNNSIIDVKDRNARSERHWQENDVDRAAKLKVKKPSKVKPGYKKKYKQKVAIEKKKLNRIMKKK
ncbi:DEAD/DEAH box helicase [Hujiaoplasma nucleasis]|uniref:DEAD/DEAH box helicase n=1 Tax=Hujiaoplasma nucleasis TaxID=2725268 RepID=A0A7L6N0E8_9MOLU|nr:DEAD/DEAH box helicase [Hujiaoplasma nucleasis]QLY39730.1 DEAD/DEAH box helicase [Hujiaoplasma nucleasis]